MINDQHHLSAGAGEAQHLGARGPKGEVPSQLFAEIVETRLRRAVGMPAYAGVRRYTQVYAGGPRTEGPTADLMVTGAHAARHAAYAPDGNAEASGWRTAAR
jgi:hypothetical protein